jgi:hypothetical protein
MKDDAKAAGLQFILHPSYFILPAGPVSSDRLERQSYKLEVEGSTPSPAIEFTHGDVAQAGRAFVS